MNKEIMEVLVPKEFKYTSLGYNFGFVLGLILSLNVEVSTSKILIFVFLVLVGAQIWSMKDELREFFR